MHAQECEFEIIQVNDKIDKLEKYWCHKKELRNLLSSPFFQFVSLKVLYYCPCIVSLLLHISYTCVTGTTT